MSWRALAMSSPLLLHCTLLYGGPTVEQCETDADCTDELNGAEGYCDPDHAVCVRAEASSLMAPSDPGVCADLTLNPSCSFAATSDGDDAACPFASRDCPCVTGAHDAPDALVVGTMSPHTYRTSTGASLQIPYVPRWLQSIELGLHEWRETSAGGRLPRTSRPVAVVHCNSSDHLPTARRAMEHLLDVAHAPIVLTLTDNDTEAVRYQALRQSATVLCATCFERPPDDPEETRLIWHVAPPLVDQAPLYVWRVLQLEAELRARRALAPDAPVEVVLLTQDYQGINDLAAAILSALRARSSLRVTLIQTSDPRYRTSPPLEIARGVVSARPELIAVVMDSDFTTYQLRMIEAEWPPGEPRPTYVATHMNQELGLFSELVGNDEDLRQRLGGTGFALSPAASDNLNGLGERFSAAYSKALDNTQYGYDALYGALYALLMTEASRSIDGEQLSVSLGRLGSGAAIDVGPGALPSAMGYLSAGQSLDLTGTSGDLAWHPTTHETAADVGLWCLSRDAQGALGLRADAGVRWRHDTGEITGDYVCP